MKLNADNIRKLSVWGIAMLSFSAGALLAAGLTHLSPVKADNNRVFELRVYHALPGKLPALEARFRDTTSKLLAKHGLNVLGYWVTENPPASDQAFIWLLAHVSREEAKTNWDALRADPEFQEMVKAEQAERLVEKVDVTFLRPTDFSSLK